MSSIITFDARVFPNGSGDLLDPSWWTCLPRNLRRYRTRACEGLLQGFDEPFLQRLTYGAHPLGAQAIFRYGRWALLRSGLALAMRTVDQSLVNELQDAKKYSDFTAELDFGLFLSAGGHVQWQPFGNDGGPDYLLSLPGELIAFEAKHPHQSSNLRSLELFVGGVSQEASRIANSSKLRGWSLEIAVPNELILHAATCSTAEVELRGEVFGEIEAWVHKPRSLAFARRRGVSLSATRCSIPNVQVAGPSFRGRRDLELRRLHEHLDKAASQLLAGGVPGFAVFSREESGLVRNYARDLIGAIREDRDGKFAMMLGLVFYDLEVIGSWLLPTAYVSLRHESKRLVESLSSLGRGGRVRFELF